MDLCNDCRSMLEFLKHALGLCGESHPNLITILLGTPVIGYLTYKLKMLKNKN